jgi:helix-turn-helix protein
MRNRIAPQPAIGTPTGVEIFPPNMVRRRMATWTGIQVESLELTRLERFECRVKSSSHILIVAERGERDDGETVVEGFQRSTQERAKTLLEERTRSVTEVGLMLGFAETSSFTTSFRRTVGVTPSDFRRSIL